MDITSEILKQTDWLYVKIFQNSLFFVDFWTLVHAWTGFGIIILAKFFRLRKPVLLMTLILFIYEIAEILFLYFAMGIFKPETLKDQITDIVAGFAGGITAWYFLSAIKKGGKPGEGIINQAIMFYSATTIAFFWTGFYQYQYNLAFINSAGINYWAFLWWAGACYLLMNIFSWFHRLSAVKALLLTYAIYLPILLLLEYLGYYCANMHEIGHPGAKALVLSVIHGTTALHIFYLLAPVLSYAAYKLAEYLLFKAA